MGKHSRSNDEPTAPSTPPTPIEAAWMRLTAAERASKSSRFLGRAAIFLTAAAGGVAASLFYGASESPSRESLVATLWGCAFALGSVALAFAAGTLFDDARTHDRRANAEANAIASRHLMSELTAGPSQPSSSDASSQHTESTPFASSNDADSLAASASESQPEVFEGRIVN